MSRTGGLVLWLVVLGMEEGVVLGIEEGVELGVGERASHRAVVDILWKPRRHRGEAEGRRMSCGLALTSGEEGSFSDLVIAIVLASERSRTSMIEGFIYVPPRPPGPPGGAVW